MKPSLSRQTDEHNFHSSYRADIDGLRAIAILAVVLFHAFPLELPGGFVGVDIFFVISGYLISTIIFRSLQHEKFSFVEFYAHRIKRIFPALIVVLTACYAVGWLTLLPDEFKQLGKHIAAGAGFIQNFVLWQEIGYFDTSADLKPLLHLWSLAIEEQFYLIFPIFIFITWRLGINSLVIILIFFLFSFALNLSEAAPDPSKTFFMPQTRFWEILAGSILAYLKFFKNNHFSTFIHEVLVRHFSSAPFSGQQEQIRNNILSAVGALLLVISVSFINKTKIFPGGWALLPVSASVLLIWAGPRAWLNRIILANKLMVFIGLISYPLYLWHWPILSFARIVEGETPSPAVRTAAVALSVLLAWLTYKLIEKPIRFGKKTWMKTAALSVALIIVGYVGYDTYQRNGLAFRIPDEIRKIADFQYDYAKDARAGQCWLSAEQSADGFASECLVLPDSKDKESILVWGDSHAARFYPGLREALGNQASISQLTRDSCPPISDYSYPLCQASNDYIISTIKQNPPSTVIMFAVWNNYQTDWNKKTQATHNLLKTINEIKQSGVKKIVVLGPAPSWKQALPKLMYGAWKDSFPRQIPEWLENGLNLEAQHVDAELRQILVSEPVQYVSVLQVLCQKKGCLTHTPERPAELFSWDYGHLTTAGSAFLSRRLLTDNVLP